MENKKQSKISIWKVPQFSVAIFVIISAFTTGQGMTDTFFHGNFLCGVGISAGIQLLLVWMGWKAPRLFSMGDRTARIFLVVTYAFTIIWSTGFSFVYVCNHIYSSIYMRDDQSLLADTYRKNMVELNQRAENDFNQYLDIVIDDIGRLQEKASGMDGDSATSVEGTPPDYAALRKYYADNTNMMDVIHKCENISAGRSIGDAKQMHDILGAALSQLSDDKDTLVKMNEQNKRDLKDAENEIADFSQRKYQFKTGTTADIELEILITDKKENKGKITDQIITNETEQKAVDDVMKAVKSLDSYISLKEGSVNGVLTAKFAQILAELGSASPQMEIVNQLSDESYEELTTALQTDGSNAVYSELLRDYLSLKESLKILEEIRSVQAFCYNEDMSVIIGDTERFVSSTPSRDEKEQWRNLWNDKFVEIKSGYYNLPSASEKAVAENYEYVSRLQRSLLTELNGIEHAIYYLTGAQSLLAWLSLGLALFLDMTPILLMIIKQHLVKTAARPQMSGNVELLPNV